MPSARREGTTGAATELETVRPHLGYDPDCEYLGDRPGSGLNRDQALLTARPSPGAARVAA